MASIILCHIRLIGQMHRLNRLLMRCFLPKVLKILQNLRNHQKNLLMMRQYAMASKTH